MAKVHVGCSRSERPGQTQGRGHHPVHYYSPDASRRASGDMARYQTWSIETGVHEAGVRALLTIMSAAMPNTKQFIACAPDGSICICICVCLCGCVCVGVYYMSLCVCVCVCLCMCMCVCVYICEQNTDTPPLSLVLPLSLSLCTSIESDAGED